MKLLIEQAQRSNSFRFQSEITERVAVTKRNGQNSFTKRKTGVFSMEGKWVLFKRGLVYFSTFARLVKPRDISGRSEEHRSVQPQATR